MAVNETIVTGRKFRKLIDEANKLWQRISFWTKSSDVEFDDGKNAETKVGAIDGITSDLNGESETIAASIKCVNELNNNLGGLSFYEDPDGNKYVVGADAVPKKLGSGNKAQVFTSSPVDMKKYTDDWASLVAEDFKVGCAGVTATASCHGDVATVSAAPGTTLSYDPLNGILTFGISGSTSSSYQQLRLSCTVRSIFAVYLGTVRGALD